MKGAVLFSQQIERKEALHLVFPLLLMTFILCLCLTVNESEKLNFYSFHHRK